MSVDHFPVVTYPWVTDTCSVSVPVTILKLDDVHVILSRVFDLGFWFDVDFVSCDLFLGHRHMQCFSASD